jgi:two-component system sensor histidine kinase MprB
VRVLDQGPGFSDAELPQLFDLFYRAPSTVAVAGGAGIGLFVARRLAEAMGGTIWAARRERGAEFGFSLRALEEAY